MSTRHTYIALGLLLGITFPLISLAQQPGDILRRIQLKYASAPAIQVTFQERILSPDAPEDSITLTGTFYLQGNQYRIETPNQTIVTDGHTIWIYTRSDQQVIIDYYQEDSSFISPRNLLNFSSEQYTIENFKSTPDGFELTLRPRETHSLIHSIHLWITPTYDLQKVLLQDINGLNMLFAIEDLKLLPELPAQIFHFSPPSHAEVIDLRL